MTQTADDIGLMPWPAGRTLTGGTPLAAGSGFAPAYPAVRSARLQRAVARLLDARPADRGTVPLSVDCRGIAGPCPRLGDDESYTLSVASEGVTLSAAGEWGVLRGLATLTQLAGGGDVPAQRIVDRPRFPWRGLMLDVARHFLPLDDLLRTLDGMAMVKLNVLHLHLSDDQGFRFPSRQYPRLATAPHYQREELQRLVGHAAELGIRVVPELDVPGHATCWLRAYPEWGSATAESTRRFGVHRACLDPTRDGVMTALAALFAELAEVFPDEFLHFGGDEVHPDWWSRDPAVRSYMAEHGLADAAALQASFTARLADALADLGRRPLGWDEVLHGSLAAGVAVQSWRGAGARDRALAAGHDCILSAPYYLDLMYPADLHYAFDPAAPEADLLALEDAMPTDPRLVHIAAGMTWTRQWRDTPVPARGTGPARGAGPGRLLGAEACLWSELVDADTLDVRLWSRLPALAERFWSPLECGDVASMRRRLDRVLAALPRWVGVDVAGDVRRLCARAGLSDVWWPLVQVLEPVKWYARLLGEEALAARLQGREMPQARPYDADTPLDRVVDALPPEALGVPALRQLLEADGSGDQDARAALATLAREWRDLPEQGAPAELLPLAQGLAGLGAALAEWFDGRGAAAALRGRLAALAAPEGEYLLAPVPLLVAWLEMAERPP